MKKIIRQPIFSQYGKILLIGSLGILVGNLGGLFAKELILVRFFDNLHWTSGTLAAAVCAWLSYKKIQRIEAANI
jgi:hypothetical protein